MKLHLVSDLHLDSYGGEKASIEFLKGIDPEDADMVVVAGDAFCRHKPQLLSLLFGRLLELYPKVLFVPGNHDYWGTNIQDAHNSFKDAVGDDARIYVAYEPTVFEIAGTSFLCGTMWYPEPNKRQLYDFVDFQETDAPRAWFFDQFKAFKKLLLEKGTEDTVVVTHHLPHPASTPLRFRGSDIDHFFMTNMTDSIMKVRPKLFMHGHTHDPCDYEVGKTRIVCNPRGYPPEYRYREDHGLIYKPLLIEV